MSNTLDANVLSWKMNTVSESTECTWTNHLPKKNFKLINLYYFFFLFFLIFHAENYYKWRVSCYTYQIFWILHMNLIFIFLLLVDLLEHLQRLKHSPNILFWAQTGLMGSGNLL